MEDSVLENGDNGKKRVETRLIFVKIGQVYTANERYDADVFIQAQWREPLLDNMRGSATKPDLSKYWNPKLKVENAIGDPKESISMDLEYHGKNKDKALIVEKRRIKGTFLELLELNHFPFDCQDLSITISSEYSTAEVELTETTRDISRVNQSNSTDSQEWDVHFHIEITQEEMISDSNSGPITRPTITFTTRASRRFPFFAINNILISIGLTLLAFFAFAVPRNQPFGRIQLSFILLLTTVTFKSATSQNLPKVPYLTCLDKLILANMCMIVINSTWHAAISAVDQTWQLFTDLEPYVVLGFGVVYVFFLFIFGLSIYFDAGARRREMRAKDREYKKKIDVLEKASLKRLAKQTNIAFFNGEVAL